MKSMTLREAEQLAKSVFSIELRWFGDTDEYLIGPATFRSTDKRYYLRIFWDGGSEVYDRENKVFVGVCTVNDVKWYIKNPKTLVRRLQNVVESVRNQSGRVQDYILDCAQKE